jgi:CDP-paratose 2-epimerase
MSHHKTCFLVTGGAGFVGSSIALYLKRKHPKAQVISLDNLKRRGSELSLPRLRDAGIDFIHGDVRELSDIEQAGPVDWLFECSAEPSVQAGYNQNPSYVTQTNLIGAINCLEHLRRSGGRMMFLSTSRVYPIDPLRNLPLGCQQTNRLDIEKTSSGTGFSQNGISESFPLDGARSLYGATKLCAEHYITEYGSMYGIETIINRCGILAGPWQMGKVDQGVLTLWMARHLFGGSLKYIGFGGEGHQVRDALHVDDLCELIEIQMNDISRLAGSIYNVGGGIRNSVSLNQLTSYCRDISKRSLEIGSDPVTHPADIPYYVSDASRITESTSWVPKRSMGVLLEDIHHWIMDHRTTLEPILMGKV